MAPNKHAANKVLLAVRVEAELKAAAQAKAKAEGRLFPDVVRELLQRYVSDSS